MLLRRDNVLPEVLLSPTSDRSAGKEVAVVEWAIRVLLPLSLVLDDREKNAVLLPIRDFPA